MKPKLTSVLVTTDNNLTAVFELFDRRIPPTTGHLQPSTGITISLVKRLFTLNVIGGPRSIRGDQTDSGSAVGVLVHGLSSRSDTAGCDGLVTSKDGPGTVGERRTAGTEGVAVDVHGDNLICFPVVLGSPRGVGSVLTGYLQRVVLRLVEDVDPVTDTGVEHHLRRDTRVADDFKRLRRRCVGALCML